MYKFDNNHTLIKGDIKDGLKLIEGVVTYDVISINFPIVKEQKLKNLLLTSKELLSKKGYILIYLTTKSIETVMKLGKDILGEDSYLTTLSVMNGNKESQQVMIFGNKQHTELDEINSINKESLVEILTNKESTALEISHNGIAFVETILNVNKKDKGSRFVTFFLTELNYILTGTARTAFDNNKKSFQIIQIEK